MKIEIDISGQIQQIKLNSAIGAKRSDGLIKSVYINSKIKNARIILKKEDIIDVLFNFKKK